MPAGSCSTEDHVEIENCRPKSGDETNTVTCAKDEANTVEIDGEHTFVEQRRLQERLQEHQLQNQEQQNEGKRETISFGEADVLLEKEQDIRRTVRKEVRFVENPISSDENDDDKQYVGSVEYVEPVVKQTKKRNVRRVSNVSRTSLHTVSEKTDKKSETQRVHEKTEQEFPRKRCIRKTRRSRPPKPEEQLASTYDSPMGSELHLSRIRVRQRVLFLMWRAVYNDVMCRAHVKPRRPRALNRH